MTEPDPETGTNVGAARLRERVMDCVDDYVLHFDDGAGIETRAQLVATLDAYAAYEKQLGRVEALREIRDEAQRQSAAKKQGLWLALYDAAIDNLHEAEQALRALEEE